MVLKLLKLIGRKLQGKSSTKKKDAKEVEKKRESVHKKDLDKKTEIVKQAGTVKVPYVNPNYKGSNPRGYTPVRSPYRKPQQPGPAKQTQLAKPVTASKPLPKPPSKTITKWNPEEFNVSALVGKKRFQDFDLPQEIMHAIFDLKFQYCTPIQMEIC